MCNSRYQTRRTGSYCIYHTLGTKPVAAASLPSHAPPFIAALWAYKRFCFVSHIIPVILPAPTDKVKVLAETTEVIVIV